MPEIPSILGVSEIVLNVADLPRMRNFYVEVMGFGLHSEYCLETLAHDPNGESTITFLTISEPNTPLSRGGHPLLLALIDYRRHIHATKRFAGHDVKRSTLNHLAFEIPPDSFDAHSSRLQELGHELSFSQFPDLQARAMFFKEPEDNLLELICHYVE